MTYAIIETGGKQLRVEPGRFYDVELLHNEPDQTISLETVLLVQHNGDVTIGQPFIEGATVEGTIMRHLRGRKVLVYKMKPKKKTRKKRGHRQEITRLMINSISLNGSVISSEEAASQVAAGITATETGSELGEEVATEVDTGNLLAEEVAAEGAAEYSHEPVAEVAAEVIEADVQQ